MIVMVGLAPNEHLAEDDLRAIEQGFNSLGHKVQIIGKQSFPDARRYKELLNSHLPGLGDGWATDYMKDA